MLHALESFASRCPRDTQPFRAAVTACALGWSSYDPNLAQLDDADADGGGDSGNASMRDDDDGDDGDDDDDQGSDEGGDDDFDAYDDDEDCSWKVRRAALRVISALAGTAAPSAAAGGGGPEVVAELLTPLLRRLRVERTEIVRLEVAAALGECVRAATLTVAGPDSAATQARSGGDDGAGAGGAVAQDIEALLSSLGVCAIPLQAAGPMSALAVAAAADERTDVAAAPAGASSAAPSLLVKVLPVLLPAILRLLPHGSGRRAVRSVALGTRSAALSLLMRIVSLLGTTGGPRASRHSPSATLAALAPSLGPLVTALCVASAERSGPTAPTHRLSALTALHALLVVVSSEAGNGPTAAASPLAPHLTGIAAAAAVAVADDWYRASAAALRVAALVATLMRPTQHFNGRVASFDSTVLSAPDVSRAASVILTALLPRLAAHDADVEVKEAALLVVGTILAHLGDALPADGIAKMFAVLPDRLRGDATRLTTLRVIAYAAASPFSTAPLTSALPGLLPDITGFLRQASRPLRLQALATLTAALSGCGASVHGSANAAMLLRALFQDLATAVSDTDLGLATAALECAVAALEGDGAGVAPQNTAAVVQHVAETILPRAASLAASPLVSGPSLVALVDFFIAALRVGAAAAAATGGKASPLALPPLLDTVTSAAAARLAGHSSVGTFDADKALSTATASRVVAGLLGAAAEASPAGSGGGSSSSSGGVTPILATLLSSSVNGGGGDPLRVLAMHCLGEAGRLPAVAACVPTTASAALLELLRAEPQVSEALRDAAAFALGGLALGMPDTVLTAIESRLAACCAREGTAGAAAVESYGLLCALHETLLPATPVLRGGSRFTPARAAALGPAAFPVAHAAALLPLLTSGRLAGSADEGLRRSVAEAIGRLATVAPDAVIKELSVLVSACTDEGAAIVVDDAADDTPFPGTAEGARRWTAITALRVAAAHATPAMIQALLRIAPETGAPGISYVAVLLRSLADSELAVRAAALSTVNVLVHTAPALLLPLLRPVAADRFRAAVPPIAAVAPGPVQAAAPVVVAAVSASSDSRAGRADYASEGVLAVLYYESLPRAALRYEVDLGPFKHVKDDGLPLRRAAVAAIESILASTRPIAIGGTDASLAAAVGPEVLPILAQAAVSAGDAVRCISWRVRATPVAPNTLLHWCPPYPRNPARTLPPACSATTMT